MREIFKLHINLAFPGYHDLPWPLCWSGQKRKQKFLMGTNMKKWRWKGAYNYGWFLLETRKIIWGKDTATMGWSNKKIKVKSDGKPITKYEKIRFANWIVELLHTTLHIHQENLRHKWKLPLNINDHICQPFLYSTPLGEVYHWYPNLTSFFKNELK